MPSANSRSGDRILGNDTTVIFHIDIQLPIRKHALTELQNLRESICAKPMFGIRAHVRLQDNLFFFAGEPAAIDEVLYDVPNLGDVGMRRDITAIRQDKPWMSIGILFQREL